MIFPVVGGHPAVERCGVVLDSWAIENMVGVWMMLFQKCAHILNIVTIDLLNKFTSWKAHGDYSWSNIGKIQVELIIIKPVPFARHNFPNNVHFYILLKDIW